ncbi:ATP-binding protein [Desulfosediminicola ganghwensis]|uniref:ATP-binding protein n=1 Tax=Desulfosediminicola ganghwensis TaxID=2569540 RepID=UPI0010ABB4F5|nr:ATP-binding protein [Desulfosediminicola ganghwensis]
MQSNILFVDDDSSILDALEWTFSDEPYGCLTCKTPQEALKLMDEIDFAVVVSDHRMPEMCGTDFLEKIKHQWPATIRILMTAYQEMNIILNAVNKGHIYNLIFKPWDEMELKRIIKTAVDDYTLRNGGGVISRQASEADQLIELNRSLEEKNQYLMERLQQAHKMEALGNLASGIAHDFNNVLFVINGCLQMSMVDKHMTPNIRANLSQALKASGRAKDLVAQILSFSRTGENNNKPVMLTPLMREVLEFIQAALPPNIKLCQEINIDNERIQLEPTKLYQILMNLCLNAADAMRGRKGVVHISLTRARIERTKHVEQVKSLLGDYFCLTVSDNGDGIEEADMERIFDPYFTTKRKNGGTGLGLALINQIIQDQGGNISVQSEVGKGSSFTVYLPLIEDSLVNCVSL